MSEVPLQGWGWLEPASVHGLDMPVNEEEEDTPEAEVHPLFLKLLGYMNFGIYRFDMWLRILGRVDLIRGLGYMDFGFRIQRRPDTVSVSTRVGAGSSPRLHPTGFYITLQPKKSL